MVERERQQNDSLANGLGVPGTLPFRDTSNHQPCVGCSSAGSIGIATAADPSGPWTTVFPFVGEPVPGHQGSLANPSPLVLENGTLMLCYRYSNGVLHKQGEALAVAVAEQAAGPWTFLNADATALNVEDPALYLGARGYHIVAHQYNDTFVWPNGTVEKLQYGDPRMQSGAHMYSVDGVHWRTSPYALYNNSISWANGSDVVLNYRERPEVVVDEKTKRPMYLVTGAEWGHKCAYPTCKPGQSCQSISMITEILHD